MQVAKGILSLLKLKTVALLVIVALVSAIVASRGMPWDMPALAILMAAGALACAGSGALNHYFDRDIDPLQVRTSRRPLPTGQIRPQMAAFVGAALIAISLALSWQLNWIVSLFIGLGILTYVVIYTCWLKRRTRQNIVIGGLAGSWAVLSGWFTASHEVSIIPILLALTVFLWTPVHFWSLSLAHLSDYRRVGLPMLPVVAGEKKTILHIFTYAILSICASGLLLLLGKFNSIYPVAWLLMAAIFCLSNLRLFRGRALEWAHVNYKISGLYLLVIFLAMGLDAVLA